MGSDKLTVVEAVIATGLEEERGLDEDRAANLLIYETLLDKLKMLRKYKIKTGAAVCFV